LSWVKGTRPPRGHAEAVRRLVEIERASWFATPLESENRPMTDGHLLSPLSIIARRYRERPGGIRVRDRRHARPPGD
jgi:hypothetical protein